MAGRAYYNEIDGFAAAWLRNLISAGLIAPGDVDERSIVDVRPDDLRGYAQCHFFAGIGGWSRAARLAGWPDDRPLWTGSCPCQPFSLAGKQKGFEDDRHLWPVFAGLIRECRPPVVFGEQVASATEWLRLVRSDLEAMGFAVGAMPVQAASAGADHLRDRYWFVADADDEGPQGRQLLPERAGERIARANGLADDLADAGRGRFSESGEGQIQQPGRAETERAGGGDLAESWSADKRRYARNARGSSGTGRGEARSADGNATHGSCASGFEWVIGADGKARRVKPGVRLLAHGIPGRVGLLRGFGNAIDPRPAAEFIGAYLDILSSRGSARSAA